MSVDYGSFARGRGLNDWELDGALRREVGRTVPPGRLDAVSRRVAGFGELVGGRVAPNTDVVDANGPVLRTDDREGEFANEVSYHPAHLENERLADGPAGRIRSVDPVTDREFDAIVRFARFDPTELEQPSTAVD